MELYINNNVSDITYMSELTPHPAYGRQVLKSQFLGYKPYLPKGWVWG